MATSNPFTVWQVIYDRPFASPVELFHVPLYGPHWNPGAHRGLELLNVQTGKIEQTALRADAVVKALCVKEGDTLAVDAVIMEFA